MIAVRSVLLCLPILCAAQTAQYPNSIVTDNQLMVAKNQVTSALLSPMAPGDTTAALKSTAGFLANMLITIDNEVMQICSVTGANTVSIGHSSCPNADGRGFDGSTAAAHAVNRTVSAFIDAWHHNAVAAEIKAIEANARLSPWIDIRPYGAVCNGSNVTAAVTAAIAAGSRRLYIPDGCVYTPLSLILPAGVQFYCENDLAASITTPNPATDHLYFGAGASITHCGVKNAFCQQAANPQNVPKTCPVGYAENRSDSGKIVTWWVGARMATDYGPTLQAEPAKNISGVANNGSGLIRVTTSSAHGYNTGDWVVVLGVGGVPNANRVSPGTGFILGWSVTVINAVTFDLVGSTFAGSYTSGGSCYRAAVDMQGDVVINRTVGDARYTELASDGVAHRIEITGNDRPAGDTAAAKGTHLIIHPGTGPVLGNLFQLNSTDPGVRGYQITGTGCTGRWLDFSDSTNGTALTAGCNGALALSSGAFGLFPQLSLSSARTFTATSDGILIPFFASNGTAATSDFGAIVVGSNPATGDGGGGKFQLCVGGNASTANPNSCFLSATATTSGSLDRTLLGSTSTATLETQAVFQQSFNVNNIPQMKLIPAGAQVRPSTFSALGAVPLQGTFVYCTDCTTAATCAAGGAGHMAVSNGTAWTCQ